MFFWLAMNTWDIALHRWLPDKIAVAAADRPGEVLVAVLAMSFALGYRVYRAALAGHWRGVMDSIEFAVFWEIVLCSLATLATVLIGSASGLTDPVSGVLRDSAYAAIAFGAWRIYPWLEHRGAALNRPCRQGPKSANR